MDTHTPFLDRPAPLPARVAARAVDGLGLAAAAVALGLRMGFGFDWFALVLVSIAAYFVLSDALAGATFGKRLFGLQVQGPDGGRPTLRQAALRESFTLIGALPFVGPPAALVAWSALAWGIHRSGVGTHDRLAGGTRVVRRG